MQAAISIVFLILFLLLINKWKFFNNPWVSIKELKGVFIFKVIIGFLLFWVYTNHYTGIKYSRQDADIFKYFDDSKIIHHALTEKPIDFVKIILSLENDENYFSSQYYINMNHWDNHYNSHFFNDARVIIKINAIIRVFSFGNYYVHILCFCFIGFTGIFALFKAFASFLKNKEKLLFYALMLTPSILFWSSGVLKEPIMLYCIGFSLFYITKPFSKKIKPFSLLNFSLCLITLFFLKFYLFSILAILTLPFLINNHFKIKKPLIPYLACLAFFGVSSLFISQLNPKLNILELIDSKQENFISETKYKNAGSYFEITNIEPTALSILKTVPEGLFNSLTRPFIWNINSAVQVPAVIENILFIFLIVLAIHHYLKTSTIKPPTNFILFCLFFTLITFSLIGIITPVSGALVRYKIAALPFLIMIIISGVTFKKVK